MCWMCVQAKEVIYDRPCVIHRVNDASVFGFQNVTSKYAKYEIQTGQKETFHSDFSSWRGLTQASENQTQMVWVHGTLCVTVIFFHSQKKFCLLSIWIQTAK